MNEDSLARNTDSLQASDWKLTAYRMPQDQFIVSSYISFQLNVLMVTIVSDYTVLEIEIILYSQRRGSRNLAGKGHRVLEKAFYHFYCFACLDSSVL